MLDALIRDALSTIWCSPYQDRQVIIQLARHTAGGGVRRRLQHQWESEDLPTERDYYHIYGIGRNNPSRLNLPSDIGKWFLLRDVCLSNDLVAEVYTEGGIIIPRGLVYVKRTVNRGFIFAVQLSRRLPDLDTNALFIRFYSNAYYQSPRFTGTLKLASNGKQIETVAEALPLQWEHHQHLALPEGKSYAYINGFYVDDFKPMDVSPRDHVEWFYDASIKETFCFKLDDLKTFTSALDQQQKYLLHPPKDINTIDYFDDCDLYIVKKIGDRFRGRYIHRNSDKTLRQVTHNDYAVSVLTVQRFIDLEPEWRDTRDIYLMLHIRHSGYNRPLKDEHLRIKELYKLTDDEIVRAMVGIDATLPEWRAARLENSNYVRIMRSYYQQISGDMVVDAYGYNALVKALADTPQRIIDGSALLPTALSRLSTIYEYDAQGKLLGFYPNVNRQLYVPVNSTCTHVEGVVGIGSYSSGIRMNNRPFTLNPEEEYRYYVCSVDAQGQALNNWVDVTGDTTKYRVFNNQLTWLIDPVGQLGAIKGTSQFVSYTQTITPIHGIYRFTLNHQVPGNVLPIPPGVIDVWLNGYSLIEGVDYYVDFPEICIVNKKHLSANEQTVTVRCYGFCESDFSRRLPTDQGFVLHNTISLNNTYNIRDDKVVRCVVGGKVFLRDQLQFAENTRMVDVPAGLNGLPYTVSDIPQALHGLVAYNNYPHKQRSHDMDERVSNYLSSRLPEPLFDDTPYIPDLYPVYSPFLTVIMTDLINGHLKPMRVGASDQEVLDYLAPYRQWLKYEPAIKESRNPAFVAIHAHPHQETVLVDELTYGFLERVIRLFLRNQVLLTHSVQIQVTSVT